MDSEYGKLAVTGFGGGEAPTAKNGTRERGREVEREREREREERREEKRREEKREWGGRGSKNGKASSAIYFTAWEEGSHPGGQSLKKAEQKTRTATEGKKIGGRGSVLSPRPRRRPSGSEK